MGFNTVAFMLNDMAGELRERDDLPQFLHTCMASGMGGEIGQMIRVMPSEHADSAQVFIAGGNTIRRVPVYLGYRQMDDESLLRALADKLGYSLRKKAPRKAVAEGGE